MKIETTRRSDYGMRAAVCLAGNDPQVLVTAAEISRETEIPQGFLHQVLQSLQRGGLVRSTAGRPAAQPRQPVGGRVTGNPGINDCKIGIAGLKRRLQLCRKDILRFKPKSGGEAVTQHQERDRLGKSQLN